MALAQCTVSGVIQLPDTTVPVYRARLVFILSNVEVETEIVVPIRVEAIVNTSTGAFTVGLWPNALGTTESAYYVTLERFGATAARPIAPISLGTIYVPNSASAAFADLIQAPPFTPPSASILVLANAAKDDAAASATSAMASRASAAASAANALVSENSAAADAVLTAADVVSADAARTAAELAATAAGATIYASLAAGEAATSDGDVFLVAAPPAVMIYENDTGSGVFLGWLGRAMFDTFTQLNTSPATYSEDTRIQVIEGDYTYKAAASDATDHHLTTTGGSQKLYMLPKASRVVEMAQGGGVADAVVVANSATITSGTDCAAAFAAALAAIGDAGGTVVFGPGDWITYQALRIPSNVTVDLAGGRIFGTFSLPAGVTARRGHFNLAVFAFYGEETDADHAARVGTGDYFVSDPRAFATSSQFRAGTSAVTAASIITDVAAGDYLWLSNGTHIGWHPVNSELVRVASVSSTTINLVDGLRFEYDNRSNSIGQFALQFNLSNPPPGVLKATYDAWAVAGWRRVQPVKNVTIKNGTIVSLVNYGGNGYATFAVLGWCASNCKIENIETLGGQIWTLDCQDIEYERISEGPAWWSGAFGQKVVPANGSNNVSGRKIRAGMQIEEGGNDIFFEDSLFTNLQVISYCRRVHIKNSTARAGVGNAVDVGDEGIGGSRSVLLENVKGYAPGSGLGYSTPTLQDFSEEVPAALWRTALPWFNPLELVLKDCEFSSTSASQAVSLLRAPRSIRTTLGSDGLGGVVAASAGGDTWLDDDDIVGQTYTGALPTFPAGRVGRRVFKSDRTATARCINLREGVFNANISTTIFQVPAPFTADGSWLVDDVVEILMTDGTETVFHTSVITAADSGTFLVTIADALPSGFTAVIDANALVRAWRWRQET